MIGATSQGRFNFKGAASTRAIDSAPSEDKTFATDTEGGDGIGDLFESEVLEEKC